MSSLTKYLYSCGAPVSQKICRSLARSDSAAYIIPSVQRLPHNLPAQSASAANYKHAVFRNRSALRCRLSPQQTFASLPATCRVLALVCVQHITTRPAVQSLADLR